MTLVYHGTPTLYPEAGDVRMGAVRFAQPVRLSSLRVLPDGVECPGGGVGGTCPSQFTLEVLLNIAPSDPVNALAKTTAQVVPSTHALDFALDMPEGTTTRLVVLRAPALRITLSLYAHDVDTATPMGTAVLQTAPTPLRFPSAESLLSSLSSLSSMDTSSRSRALSALSLLAQRSLSLESVLASPHVHALSSASSSELNSETEEALASILGLTSATIDVHKSLRALLALPSQPWATTYPETEAPLSLALRLAEVQAVSTHPRAGEALATTIGRLAAVLSSSSPPSKVSAARLARALPSLAANAITRGHPVSLPTSLDARVVLRSLLPATAAVAIGRSCAPAARSLAASYLSCLPADDPLRRAWERPSHPPTASASTAASANASPLPSVPTLHVSEGAGSGGGRGTDVINSITVARVSRTLDAGSGSMPLSPTPAELLAAVAPGLLGSLSTAKVPPLGIPASRAAHGSASDYAGKVYSAHEFRREREMVSGLGVGASSAGRKASRHVDEFGS